MISSAIFLAACSGGDDGYDIPEDHESAPGTDPNTVSGEGPDDSTEEAPEDTGYLGQYLDNGQSGGFMFYGDNNDRAYGETDEAEQTAAESEEAFPSLKDNKSGVISGQANSNSMYSLWKPERMIANYFYLGNTEDESGAYLHDSPDIYYYFDEDNLYRIFSFDSSGTFYINSMYTRLYSYKKTTGEILMRGILNGGFHTDGDRAVFSYFNTDDGMWYCHLLSKLQGLEGEFKNVSDEIFRIRMWEYYAGVELPAGDGKSKGAMDITVDYRGTKKIGERSPIVVLLKNAGEISFTPVAGGAVSSMRLNRIKLAGIPDGSYHIFAIRLNNILKSVDPSPGDVYAIYDHSCYGGPAPVTVEVRGGDYHNILINFDDKYSLPASVQGENFCPLNKVTRSLDGNIIKISVDIDTGKFDTEPSASVYIFAPSAYRYNQARFDRGQKIEIDLVLSDNSSVWEGEAVLPDYAEGGAWKLGIIQLEGVVEGRKKIAGYSMAFDGRIQDVYWYYDWSGDREDVKIRTNIRVQDFNLRPKSPDVSPPALAGISAAGYYDKKVEFTVNVENTGSSGHRLDVAQMDQYPVQLYLFHEDNSPSDIDVAHVVEFSGDPEISGNTATYRAVLDLNELPRYGDWEVRAVQLIDEAGNNSYYFIYDDEMYSGIYNFWGNDGTYCLNGFGPDLPVSTGIEMISITKKADPDIYICGYYNMDSKFSRFSDDEQIPVFWVNGEMRKMDLSYRTFAVTQSIHVRNRVVWAAGYAYIETDPEARGSVTGALPCLWKDGRIRFLDETHSGRANSVFAAGDDIYIAGYYRNDSGQNVACLWKASGENISRFDITAGGRKGRYKTEATSVFVSSGEVNVIGNYTEGDGMMACLWRYDAAGNLLETKKLGLDGFNDSIANSIYLSAGNVYITADYSGNEQLKTIAALWINGEKDTISWDPDVSARSIFAADDYAYICGDFKGGNGERRACMWQAGAGEITRFELEAPEGARAYSVRASSNDLYVSGSFVSAGKAGERNTACFWKNGERTVLSGCGVHNSEALAVFVEEKK